MRKKGMLWAIIPVTSVYVAFFIYPIVSSVGISFTKWSGFSGNPKFVGIANYVELCRDSLFIGCIRNTFIYMIFGGILIFLLALLFVFIFTNGVKFKKLFRTIIFLPNTIALVALASVWNFIYNPNFGLLNNVLRSLGLEMLTRPWTAPNRAIWAILVAIVWIYVGFYMIILLAGAEKIPPSLYESAELFGASRIQKFFYITLPLITEELRIAITLWFINAIKMFGFIYAFGSAGYPSNKIWTGSVYMYILSFGKRSVIYRLGYASAVAVSLLILIMVTSLVTNRILKTEMITL